MCVCKRNCLIPVVKINISKFMWNDLCATCAICIEMYLPFDVVVTGFYKRDKFEKKWKTNVFRVKPTYDSLLCLSNLEILISITLQGFRGFEQERFSKKIPIIINAFYRNRKSPTFFPFFLYWEPCSSPIHRSRFCKIRKMLMYVKQASW